MTGDSVLSEPKPLAQGVTTVIASEGLWDQYCRRSSTIAMAVCGAILRRLSRGREDSLSGTPRFGQVRECHFRGVWALTTESIAATDEIRSIRRLRRLGTVVTIHQAELSP
jgi:hypothetical protein